MKEEERLKPKRGQIEKEIQSLKELHRKEVEKVRAESDEQFT